jgi:lysophospholipase L1-like esterase
VSRRRRVARAAGLAALAPVLAVAGLVAWSQPPAPFAPRDRPPPPGAVPERVAVLGTSLSARSDWPAALEAALSACLGRPARVAVVARPGASAAWGMGQLDRVAAHRPDLVLIEFAINDADLLDGLSPGRAASAHEVILTELAAMAPGARLVLMTMSPAHGPRGWVRPRLEAHYALYPRLAAVHGAGLVDLYPRWLARPDPRADLPDGLHPTDAAARAVILPPLLAALGCP